MGRKLIIDLSYHNESLADIDFRQVSGYVDGVILREGYRQAIDKKFLYYVEECKKHEIKIYGVYHFMYPLCSKDAIDESISCVNNVKIAGLDPESIYIFADYEYDTVKNAADNGIILTKDDCNVFTEAFCAGITNLGYRAGIYMNRHYYTNYYIPAIKNKYPIWLADYNETPMYSCMLQQYSSGGRVPGIAGDVDMNWWFTDETVGSEIEKPQSLQVIELATSWIGKNEKDGSYKEIIDIYNSYTGTFPRGIKMQYAWSWCACTWSALAIKLGLTDIMPIEISCGELVKRAQDMGIWIEDDKHVPSPGDAVLYDWDDSGSGDNVGWPDHIGLVDYVNRDAGYFTTIEGNYNDAVKKRTVAINGKFIRGFIHPEYKGITSIIPNPVMPGKDINTVAHEVIAGQWGSGDIRKNNLASAGYNYAEVQNRVNEILNGTANEFSENLNVDLQQPYNNKIVSTCEPTSHDTDRFGAYKTTADLYLRNDAGTNKKALCIIPINTTVRSSGYYTDFNGVPWLYVNFIMNGTYYGGFSSSKYLTKQ